MGVLSFDLYGKDEKIAVVACHQDQRITRHRDPIPNEKESESRAEAKERKALRT